jgi:cation transporter-like permease
VKLPLRESDPQTANPVDSRPWSPLALTLLSLVLGVGALIMAVRNLERLEAIDSRTTRFYTWATVALMAAIFVLIWSFNPKTFGHSAAQLLPVSLGAPVACYLIQINSFRQWRQLHPDAQTRPWYTSLLPMIGFALLVVVLAGIVIGILQSIFQPAV